MKVAHVKNMKHAERKTEIIQRTVPGLVTFQDIQPGNRLGPFFNAQKSYGVSLCIIVKLLYLVQKFVCFIYGL